MHLACRVCGGTQPVNVADEADDDPRTQGIRRSFRAEHVASCGDGTVTLRLHAVNEAPPIDTTPQPWTTAAPEGISLGADGFFFVDTSGQSIWADKKPGWWHGRRVCEDCWEPIPRYVDFPLGLTSPESDKQRATAVEGRAGLEHLMKAVCLPCYLVAFARVYPESPRPDFCADVFADVKLEARIVAEHQRIVDMGFQPEPQSR